MTDDDEQVIYFWDYDDRGNVVALRFQGSDDAFNIIKRLVMQGEYRESYSGRLDAIERIPVVLTGVVEFRRVDHTILPGGKRWF